MPRTVGSIIGLGFSKNDSGRVFAFPVGAKELNAVNETDLDTEEERQHKIKMVVIGES